MLQGKRRVKSKRLALQLTSLLDMFTIILVFLMVSFQAEDQDFVLHSGVSLPASTAKSPFKPGVNVAITLDAVYVEGKVAHKLQKGGNITNEDYEAGRVEDVVAATKVAWNNVKKDEGDENIVLIQADKKLPYRTLNLVMRSAAHAGFFRFRLAVEKE